MIFGSLMVVTIYSAFIQRWHPGHKSDVGCFCCHGPLFLACFYNRNSDLVTFVRGTKGAESVKGNESMGICILFLFGYLFGSIPFGLLLSKWAGRDIRKEGSCNIGATNVLRVCGWKWGIPALTLDMAKGAIPVLLTNIESFRNEDFSSELLSAITGFAAILGHTFPIYLNFRGGKGVATSGGVLLALMPQVTLLALLVFVVIVVLSRYVSVGSTGAGIAIVTGHHLLGQDIYGASLPITIVTWLILFLVIFCHRSNYIRLIRGTENKLGSIKNCRHYSLLR